jgi:chloride channel protein, CIC family
MGGALLVGGFLQWVSTPYRAVGIVHVIERLDYHQASLPIRNVITQFIGAFLSLASGHSVGREGPSIHLGAGVASYFGRKLTLPNPTIRILVGCGSAAAIAASFNTPLAGVIFAMEVIMMEYTISGFTPVILASVAATTLSRSVFGVEPVFDIPTLTLDSLGEIPYMIIIGIIIGTIAGLFIRSLLFFTQWKQHYPVWVRVSIAGFIVASLGLFIPEVLGMGYDTVNAAMLGELSLSLMLGLLLVKLIATTACLGLGIPGGLIGPVFVIGATAGGSLGLIAQTIVGDSIASHGFYALIGMAAMMGATLQAPLAALVSILELTANPHIILPGMLAIVSATLMSSEILQHKSIFRHLMLARNIDYQNDALTQSLRRISVAGVMDKHFCKLPVNEGVKELTEALQSTPKWIIYELDDRHTLMQASDLVHYLQNANHTGERVNLDAIPAKRKTLGMIYWQATLHEAKDLINDNDTEALLVYRLPAAGLKRFDGVITKEHIEAGYKL